MKGRCAAEDLAHARLVAARISLLVGRVGRQPQLEPHYIVGLGDGSGRAEIPVPLNALRAAEAFLDVAGQKGTWLIDQGVLPLPLEEGE
jgi:hypothetical protein